MPAQALRVLACWAALAAAGDGLSTLVGLRYGGIEVNPLLGPAPNAEVIVLLTVCKMIAPLLALMAPRSFGIPFLWAAIAIWGGITVNNLVVATDLPDPAPILAGTAAAALLFILARIDTRQSLAD